MQSMSGTAILDLPRESLDLAQQRFGLHGPPASTSCSMEERKRDESARRATLSTSTSGRRSQPSVAATASVSRMRLAKTSWSPGTAPNSEPRSRVSAASVLPATLPNALRQTSRRRSAGNLGDEPGSR